MFVANLDGLQSACQSAQGTDVNYPDPGPDVVGNVSGPTNLVGSCPAKGKTYPVNPSNPSGPPNPIERPATSDASSSLRSPFQFGGGTKTGYTKNSTSKCNESDTSEGQKVSPQTSVEFNVSVPYNVSNFTATQKALHTSPDGSCGAAVGYSCIPGACGGRHNYCGFSEEYCGHGCQTEFGTCGRGAAMGEAPPVEGISVTSPGGNGSAGAASGNDQSSKLKLRSVLGTLFPWVWI